MRRGSFEGPYARADNRHIKPSQNGTTGFLEHFVLFVSILLFIITLPFSLFFCLLVVPEYQRVVVFRFGRLRRGRARGPGFVFVLPCVDTWYKVDMRTNSFDVPPQEILTKDSVTIKVDAVVYYRLREPLKVIIQVVDARASTQLLAQTTLRHVVGRQMLMDLLLDKDTLSLSVCSILDDATDVWGVKVERVEIKNIQLPRELQRAMAVEQEAIREAKAKIAAAEGELNAAEALKEASDIMSQNPIAMQLRYLQTLNTIAAQMNQTIILPIPMDVVMKIVNK